MYRHNNKLNINNISYAFPDTLWGLMSQPGIIYSNVILDPLVGEEIALFIYDNTDFINDISNINPFRLNLKSLVVRTKFGPIFTLLFWIEDPYYHKTPFAMFDKPIDITNSEMVKPWKILGFQSHIHLFLIGKNHEIINFYEFENSFNLTETFEATQKIDSNLMINFNKACTEYFDRYSLQDLFDL